MYIVDRTLFFDGVRTYLKGRKMRLTQSRISALEFLLGKFEESSRWSNVAHVSYAFATIAHETAYTFEPIIERGAKSYFNRYDINHNSRKARELGNIKPGDGYLFRGRGYVQLTGRTNYEKFEIENNPDIALELDTAFDIMTDGMFTGIYTGKKFSDYITSTKKDYTQARRIINGTDKHIEIAAIATAFEKILVAAKSTVKPVVEAKPVGIVSPESVPQVAGMVETSSTVVSQSHEGGTSDTATSTNEQDVANVVEIPEPEPYNKIGFWATIKRDLVAVTGGNLGLEGLTTLVQQVSGVPDWAAGLVVKLAMIVFIASIGYLLFRVIHFGVDSWKKNQKVKTEIDVQTDIHRKDIKWV